MSNEILDRLASTLEARKQADPQSSYVAKLYHKGLDAILKKIAEEAAETIMAAKDGVREKIIYETNEIDIFRLLEDRRLEAQRQYETLHKRVSDLRDELRDEITEANKEILSEIKGLREEQRAHAQEMSQRVSELERWKWIVVGAAAVLGFIFAGGLEQIASIFVK
jgi:phosphoribosyl-ATP pyrophosphohydrolase